MLQVGKPSLGRGLPLDHYAFPTIGIPPHRQLAPEIEHSMIYSVARTESAFDQRDKSAANAVGLMQVTPEAGRDTAKRFKFSYDWDRMVSDPVYNTQMGAAELSALLSEYKGNHIMTFAGYNAGRGRVRDWVKAHGDPRGSPVRCCSTGSSGFHFRTRTRPARECEFGVYRCEIAMTRGNVGLLHQRFLPEED